ncbi:MAG: hypothetical protein JXK07_04385 [Spirochaetes bacterium]|nr:hypothetical protein [Spirochaetota bacterium]MBN2772055.1 hypothetical protein [Spirochaetota bacterium]
MYVHKTALLDFLPGFAYNNWADPFPNTFPEVFLKSKWGSMEATFDKELQEICIQRRLQPMIFRKAQKIMDEKIRVHSLR